MRKLLYLFIFLCSISVAFAGQSETSSYIINSFHASEGVVNDQVGSYNLSQGSGQNQIGNLSSTSYNPQLGIYYITGNETEVVADTTPPNVTSLSFSPSSPATYSPGQDYNFNATVVDDTTVDTVTFEFDGTNYSASEGVTITDLAAGNYSYRWYANDTSGNVNDTQNGTYIVSRASGLVYAYVNGSRASKTVTSGTTLELSSNLTTGQLGRVNLSVGGTQVNTSLVGNVTAEYNFTSTSTVTAWYSGNENYTSDTESWSVSVTGTGGGLTVEQAEQLAAIYACLINGTGCADEETLVFGKVNKDGTLRVGNND